MPKWIAHICTSCSSFHYHKALSLHCASDHPIAVASHGQLAWFSCSILGPPVRQHKHVKLFLASDPQNGTLLLQVNPLAETKDGKLIAADAKLGFDDNAAFRQKELMSLRDTSQEDPRSVTGQHFAA